MSEGDAAANALMTAAGAPAALDEARPLVERTVLEWTLVEPLLAAPCRKNPT
jgi:hypothetical protein